MIEFVDYTSMMKLRRDYNLGTRNEETRAAANLYEKLRKLKMLDQLKQEAMTKRYKEGV
ncbi:hypothetical protein K5E12_20530 [Acinetobacter baumannii]|uniref:hypothetical protein n=1 Tax=Acinetobacter baumannii TaxID=470 RepID=UPI000461430F|nr:hypothetical protein [Acinetobacter baumannii]KCY22176.1 hypothetical protein J635_2260 [Acinetobacter baumannii 233846]MCJ8819818.1 hypothetical protein [Acinetobacter baumannii]MCJ8988118.1 hypothetical protein [Acinetobacter baumannii]MCJ8992074.1 hypothetical protein [Acinetobacter baumannii]